MQQSGEISFHAAATSGCSQDCSYQRFLSSARLGEVGTSMLSSDSSSRVRAGPLKTGLARSGSGNLFRATIRSNAPLVVVVSRTAMILRRIERWRLVNVRLPAPKKKSGRGAPAALGNKGSGEGTT